MAKISIHRALSQVKTTKDRIDTKLMSARFIDITIGNSGKVSGASVDDTIASIRASYDSLNALIKNYTELKIAIAKSNAGIVPETTGLAEIPMDSSRKATTTDVIILQKVLEIRQRVVDRMKSQLNRTRDNLNSTNDRVKDRLDAYLVQVGGGDKTKLSAADIDSITKTFLQNSEAKLVDPLGLEKLVEETQKQIKEDEIEYDSILSEQNALKNIEIDLMEV